MSRASLATRSAAPAPPRRLCNADSFALMALAISTHVVLAHGGQARLLGGRPWQVTAVGGLLALATLTRVMMVIQPARYSLWLGLAATFFRLATLSWALLLVPHLLGQPVPHA